MNPTINTTPAPTPLALYALVATLPTKGGETFGAWNRFKLTITKDHLGPLYSVYDADGTMVGGPVLMPWSVSRIPAFTLRAANQRIIFDAMLKASYARGGRGIDCWVPYLDQDLAYGAVKLFMPQVVVNLMPPQTGQGAGYTRISTAVPARSPGH